MENSIFTIDQAAKFLNVSTRTIRFWENKNKLMRMPGMKGICFYKLDIERLKHFINKDVVLSRRPANVFFTTLEKPPQTIDWVSTAEEKTEIFTYVKVDINKEKKLYQSSEENGWTKWGYQNVELKNSDISHKFISINNQDYILPSAGHFFCSIDKKMLIKSNPVKNESYFLNENNSRLLIMSDDKLLVDETKETITGCPLFIFFHYYDVINNEVKICSSFFEGQPKGGV